ncbi:aldo/keto reductase [Candidatus Methylomirabilis lanthanidiphila]|uniref:Aldo/keto reductase n=1 Tax=Candidatus Methylomirabilis lanthanidiphila TaxID=2211376 RepID=A0A564ZEN4_9BACT|nr:aldo/keto reductase [Candidatus Methylomirabilis lanthanidiphila]VUZ83781.1 aldo/keto reductase [Candidatus Methylomirabilis lanthanidiphila]
MEHRRLGRTGIQVSEIGFGAWGIGKAWWGKTDDTLSVRALIRALELGVTFIDTAQAYGDGHSERLIARAFQEAKHRVFVATKVPPKTREWPPKEGTTAQQAFPADWIITCTEQSLRHLDAERLDLQQLHIWRDEWLGETEWLEAVRRLKQQGKIRFFGVSIIDHQPGSALELVKSGLIDTVQVIYNIFDQSPEEELFPLCQAHDVGVIARVPFDEGGLTGSLMPDTIFPPKSVQSFYFREDRLRETCERVDRLRPLLGGEIKTVAQLALKFCLSHPAVSTVIPGMRRPEHVDANCSVSDGRPLAPETLAALRTHAWPRNFYQ